jgi:hypothetical protein
MRVCWANHELAFVAAKMRIFGELSGFGVGVFAFVHILVSIDLLRGTSFLAGLMKMIALIGEIDFWSIQLARLRFFFRLGALVAGCGVGGLFFRRGAILCGHDNLQHQANPNRDLRERANQPGSILMTPRWRLTEMTRCLSDSKSGLALGRPPITRRGIVSSCEITVIVPTLSMRSSND